MKNRLLIHGGSPASGDGTVYTTITSGNRFFVKTNRKTGDESGNRAEVNNLRKTHMTDIYSLIEKLNKSGKDVFWQGKTSQESIKKLELILDCRLSVSFKCFIAEYGGGGVVEEEVSGIEDNAPTLEHKGTVYGDTLLCREHYALPKNLVVIYLGTEDVVWCLDVSQFNGYECPVVAFDVFSKTTKPLAPTFNDFLVEYLTLKISAK